MSTPNQFVESDLLMGVSLGFHPLSVSASQPPMKGPVPNIITLPYGKCPPMHIQAPSWRQLLKLMAKLSATRIEPSVEAMAVTKGPLELRTVVQFIRVHHTSSDWRTVIYLTIDCKPPADSPNVGKYTNGDVNVLPYSYALSSLPAVLRDGPDSSLSKYFTIPSTATTPLPSLPISLPSMALYLASALEDSRKALNDSSSGVRRLAKMVDQFYPNDSSASLDDLADGTERRSFLNRLIKRSKQPTRTRNSDMYELVTPFVPEEWG
ncbi:hypothetical protein OF83DRAFT_1162292 [Amylostereum chailletii]|nr:hypothetical protein OF83DRAFT_1162292 [Amylostereum chailletii]